MLAPVRHCASPRRRRGMVAVLPRCGARQSGFRSSVWAHRRVLYDGVMAEVSVLMFRNVECLSSEEVLIIWYFNSYIQSGIGFMRTYLEQGIIIEYAGRVIVQL